MKFVQTVVRAFRIAVGVLSIIAVGAAAALGIRVLAERMTRFFEKTGTDTGNSDNTGN